MSLRMRVHDREPIGAALRRFKKLLERSGMLKEQRKRKYYEKPCEARRRATLRKPNGTGHLLGRLSWHDGHSNFLVTGYGRCSMCGGNIRIVHQVHGPKKARVSVRSYCCVPSRSFESESALLVANGSSEGFVSSLPEDSFSCVCESRLETS